MISKDTKILITGGTGMIGNSLVRTFNYKGYKKIYFPTREKLDLFNLFNTEKYLKEINPEVIIIASGRTGGIKFNKENPFQLITENLMMQNNIFFNANKLKKLKRIIFIGSSCIYPKNSAQPMNEDQILSGTPEQSNLPYAISKLAGIYTCKSINQQYKQIECSTVIPASCYGPMDNFDPDNSHVLGGILGKMVNAMNNKKDSLTLWGTGSPKREFIYVDDLSNAIEYLLRQKNLPELINIGVSEDISVKKLANIIAKTAGFRGEINWDTNQPDGQIKKLLDSSKISKLGWVPNINLQQGINKTYNWLIEKNI